VPEDCIFLSKTEREEGNQINGEYSYIDPVGSLIEVSYTMNRDMSGYVEERRVVKNYGNVSGGSHGDRLSAEKIVAKVLLDLTPTVIQVVRSTVQTSTIDLSTPSAQRQLVQTIIIKLRPVVFQVVGEVLSKSSATYLDAGGLTDLIVMELTPVIEDGVQEEATQVQLSLRNQEEQQRLEQQRLEQQRLEQQRLKQQKLEQQRLVQQRLEQQRLEQQRLEQQRLEQQRLEQQRRQEFEANVVTRITNELRPTIIRIIQATVASSPGSLSNYDTLLQTILTHLRPVVYREVETALATSSLKIKLNADTLTDRIMRDITPFVRQALDQEVQKASAELEGQVVTRIITDLKPTIIRIIQATVSSSQVDLSNVEGLLQTILTQLRPVVSNEVNNALRASNIAGNLNANSLTSRIITEMTPFVRQALQQEVQNAQATSALSEDQVVQTIITELRPTVIRIVQTTVASVKVDLSNINGLVETIVVQLRPVVSREVNAALALSSVSGSLNAQSLTQRIVNELRPFVKQALEHEVAKVQAQTSQVEDKVVQQVKTELQPTIIKVIQTTVSTSGVNLDNPQSLVETIVTQLRPVILQAVQSALSTSSYSFDANKLTVRIIIELTPFVQTGVQKEVQGVKQQSSGVDRNLVQSIIDRLRPAIIQTVKGSGVTSTSTTAVISVDLADQIVAEMPGRLQEIIRTKVSTLLTQETRPLPESVIVERIIADLQATIINIIQNDAAYNVVITKQGFGQLMQRILAALRPIIFQEIQFFQSQQQQQQLQIHQQQQVQQSVSITSSSSSGGSINSIFGISGTNIVKVDTPAFAYGYES
jgi:hypothetical protein